jgi:hypothetical protein
LCNYCIINALYNFDKKHLRWQNWQLIASDVPKRPVQLLVDHEVRHSLGLRPLIALMQSTTLGTVAIKTNPPKVKSNSNSNTGKMLLLGSCRGQSPNDRPVSGITGRGVCQELSD